MTPKQENALGLILGVIAGLLFVIMLMCYRILEEVAA